MRTQIYCDASVGSLLSVVQSSHLFPDCKHFVDMPLKNDAATTLAAWRQLVAQTGGVIVTDVLLAFINEHFDQPGGELEDHQPEDFNIEQSFDFIADPTYREFAKELHLKWPTLSRRVSEKVKSNPENYSLIDLPNAFIVPGGRFRELYYWDSFWTIKGLITSNMFGTARGMIENMASLVDRYGFIPNGNRVYYLNRSQPPLLTFCVDAYFAATKDLEFVAKIMPFLEKEMEFFMKNKLIQQDGWKSYLFQFKCVATGPRPESYREDVESAEHIECLLEKQRLWGDIAAAAESGRDFSIRWFGNEGPAANKMGSMRTSAIVPVELNSIICGNLKIFSQFYTLMGQPAKAQIAYAQFILMREAIHQVFWNETHGCWFDFDLAKNKQIELFFDTNLFPMFTGCSHESLDGTKIVQYLTVNGILNYSGGIPTSLIASAQQWDFPSGWAPMNHMIISGLATIGQTELAKTLAAKWVNRNYLVWKNSGGKMYEKYNVESECYKSKIELGEYELQEGFGWTNSVILDLLRTFSNDLAFDTHASDNSKCECCRTQPIPTQAAIFTPPQDSVCQMPSETVEIPALTEQQNVLAAVLAVELVAELAQNIPDIAINNDGSCLIRAA
jgi:alpha,alpha-trehalase